MIGPFNKIYTHFYTDFYFSYEINLFLLGMEFMTRLYRSQFLSKLITYFGIIWKQDK